MVCIPPIPFTVNQICSLSPRLRVRQVFIYRFCFNSLICLVMAGTIWNRSPTMP